ncbi:uncharacterized protein [Notamacropus eugenii]|uniref:uncharacterized protein isoform X1 n=1 Tax=Notamacropus eugenii TaxID=9315 RepID=UPI003B6818FE
MNLSLLASMPAILFLKSMALLAVMFFYPYWALFYHHHYEYLMFASPWVLCLRKQCKLIKDLGQAEACQVTMLLSMLLSLPLGLSVPAQCVGILSAPLARLMPFYTSLMCLIIGSTELLAFLFFRLLLIQLKFLLREFSMWLNWPVYFLMFSSVVYFMAGSLIFYHHLHLSNSLIHPLEKQSPSPNPIISQIYPAPLVSKQPDTLQTQTSVSPRALEVFWVPKPPKASLLPELSESPPKPQKFRASFSQMSNRSWVTEQPWVSQNLKTSSYPLGFRVQSFFMSTLNHDHSDSQSSSTSTNV